MVQFRSSQHPTPPWYLLRSWSISHVCQSLHCWRISSYLPTCPSLRGSAQAGDSTSKYTGIQLLTKSLKVADIGKGLGYMHGHDVIHGDLKGANILVSGSPTNPIPLLCDFGLSKIVDAVGFTTTVCGSPCWMAMELLGKDDEDCKLTFASDIWAWGMTVYVSS